MASLHEQSNSTTSSLHHSLQHAWNLWAHLPQDKDWSPQSYKFLSKFDTVEDTIVSMHMLPEQFIKHCMLFVMKDGILPIWEDPQNRTGGAFSYKVSNKHVACLWKDLTYALVGNTISNNTDVMNNITGITISPKNNFCVVKIWTKTCAHQNPLSINSTIRGLNARGCLFKKHDSDK